MALYTLDSDLPKLVDPVIVAAFDGWVDAAAAASSAIERLTLGANVIARFDTDALYDYRSRRPLLDVVDGVSATCHGPSSCCATPTSRVATC